MLALSAGFTTQDPTGALRGEVQDAIGGRLVKANVTVKAAGSSLMRTATTNKRGEFRIEGLLPGKYLVDVIAPGFSQAENDVPLTSV